jgi:hypothetical protein
VWTIWLQSGYNPANNPAYNRNQTRPKALFGRNYNLGLFRLYCQNWIIWFPIILGLFSDYSQIIALWLVTVTHIVLSLNHGSQEKRQGKEDYTSCWYATGTLSMRRLKPAESFWRISVKYAECRCDDTSHTQSRRHPTLHSYHSNAQRSRSVPPIIVYTLVLHTTYLSLIIFKIIPHPMTLLTAIPLQVIILHFI